MSIGTDVQRKAMWYASLTNYVGSWLLVGHLDIHKNDGSLGMGPGSSKTAGGKVATDIHGFIRSICVMEERRKEESVSRRFNHHLDRISAYEVDAKDRQELVTESLFLNWRRSFFGGIFFEIRNENEKTILFYIFEICVCSSSSTHYYS